MNYSERVETRSTSLNPSVYRSDIQGLRAIAVTLVVLFHAGLPVPGGFLGVDIFFVISGFVVGGMILREIDSTGSIDLRQFFFRRFARLFPALLVVVVFVLAISLLVLWGETERPVPLTAIASLVFSSNLVIPLVSGGYFDPETKLNSLLHTWSLGVEEQFYVFFAIFMFVLARLAKRRENEARRITHTLILSVSGVSFLIALLGSSELRGVLPFGQAFIGFYSPIPRLWEFGIGLLVALSGNSIEHSKGWRNLAFSLGMLLVGVSVLMVSESDRHPGLVTVAPTIGAAFIILSNFSRQRNVLRSRPLVFVGNISYSLYLWHWPLLVISERILPDSMPGRIIAVALSLPVAFLSYKYLEVPFRRLRLGGHHTIAIKKSLRASIATSAGLVVLSATFSLNPDLRLAKGNNLEAPEDSYFFTASNVFDVCSHPITGNRGETDGSYHGCLTSFEGSIPEIVIVGDSHASHLFFGLAEQNKYAAVAFFELSSSEWELEDPPQLIARIANTPEVRTVLLNYRWQGYDPSVLTPNFRTALQLLERRGKETLITNGGPTFPFDPAHCQFGKGILSLFPSCSVPISSQEEVFAGIDREIQVVVEGLHRVNVIDSRSAFCDDTMCSMVLDNKVMFQDAHHLNIQGSRYLAREVFPLSNSPD